MKSLQKYNLHFQTTTLFFFFISLCVAPLLMAQNTNPQVSFTKDIAPILVAKCQGCHNDKKSSMGFNLTTFSKMKQGGKQTGPEEMIVAGKPDESRFVEVLPSRQDFSRVGDVNVSHSRVIDKPQLVGRRLPDHGPVATVLLADLRINPDPRVRPLFTLFPRD